MIPGRTDIENPQDEYVLPPDVTRAYVDAQRSGQKKASEYITSGKWKGYTPPPMPKRK